MYYALIIRIQTALDEGTQMRPLRQLADIAFSLRMIIGVLETASIRDPQVRPPLHENFEAPFSLTLSVHCESNLFMLTHSIMNNL